ncbi:MAG TPA: NAD(+) kinase, partial [Sphingomonas sp.]
MSQFERRALVASPTAPAQAAAAELADAADWVDPNDADVVIALGGDGFLLQT